MTRTALGTDDGDEPLLAGAFDATIRDIQARYIHTGVHVEKIIAHDAEDTLRRIERRQRLLGDL